MKLITFLFIKLKLVFLTLIILISSCSSNKNSLKSRIDYYNDIANKVSSLIIKAENAKAKSIILDALLKEKPKKSPFVENHTLNFYSINLEQSLSHMLLAGAFNVTKHKDSVKKNPGNFKQLFELDSITPWNSTVEIIPVYPRLYLIMGIILINERNYDQAIKYLDTCTFIWDGFAIAHSEKMFCYVQKKEIEKAKEIGASALKILDIDLDKRGKASILRKLGYISVEEKNLDEGEKYYKESLTNEESEVARKELKDIERFKEQIKR